ncbi:hypothetical protein PanWU01x14_195700 [Parasponia andersonii]|uniref:Uncharacterized protein n=1 Tax=Parasponia andersonii TaxID=3476 RepID=A0A2P5BZY8_PARAD|nr:hypothetical protein PanWU01x14_195700 [Parasponia andersonii]
MKKPPKFENLHKPSREISRSKHLETTHGDPPKPLRFRSEHGNGRPRARNLPLLADLKRLQSRFGVRS